MSSFCWPWCSTSQLWQKCTLSEGQYTVALAASHMSQTMSLQSPDPALDSPWFKRSPRLSAELKARHDTSFTLMPHYFLQFLMCHSFIAVCGPPNDKLPDNQSYDHKTVERRYWGLILLQMPFFEDPQIPLIYTHLMISTWIFGCHNTRRVQRWMVMCRGYPTLHNWVSKQTNEPFLLVLAMSSPAAWGLSRSELVSISFSMSTRRRHSGSFRLKDSGISRGESMAKDTKDSHNKQWSAWVFYLRIKQVLSHKYTDQKLSS